MDRYKLYRSNKSGVANMILCPSGNFVLYENAASHIAELKADNAQRRLDYTESVKALDARIDKLEQQLAAAQERNTALQSEHLDHVNSLYARIDDLRLQLARATVTVDE